MSGRRERDGHHELDSEEPVRTSPASPLRRPRPSFATPAGVRELQRSAGNRLVARAVQAKLQVGPAGDSFEQEADRVADEVMRSLGAPVEKLEEGAGDRRVHRQVAGPAVGLGGGDLTPDVEAELQRSRGGGAPLPDSLQRSFGSAFGADLSGVRVHHDAVADSLNRSMGAEAFTIGNDIFFSRDRYRPGSQAGQRLLAHELTHTIQQGAVRSEETD